MYLKEDAFLCKKKENCLYADLDCESECDEVERIYPKCDGCDRLSKRVIMHMAPDLYLCIDCAKEVTRHLLSDLVVATSGEDYVMGNEEFDMLLTILHFHHKITGDKNK